MAYNHFQLEIYTHQDKCLWSALPPNRMFILDLDAAINIYIKLEPEEGSGVFENWIIGANCVCALKLTPEEEKTLMVRIVEFGKTIPLDKEPSND